MAQIKFPEFEYISIEEDTGEFIVRNEEGQELGTITYSSNYHTFHFFVDSSADGLSWYYLEEIAKATKAVNEANQSNATMNTEEQL